MAVQVELSDRLVVRLTGWDRVWALSSGVEVPLRSVEAVRLMSRREARSLASGLRLAGSCLPGVIQAGRYRSFSGEWSFWSVRRAGTVLVIDLVGQRYRHLVLEVDDPVTLSRLRHLQGGRSPVTD
jgi:hypothetical protein